MSPRMSFVIAIGLSVISGRTPAVAQGRDDGAAALRWKFKVGQRLLYELKESDHLDMTHNGRKTTVNSDDLTELGIEVVSVADDGSAELNMNVVRYQTARKFDERTIRYDTLAGANIEPEARPFAEIFGPIVAGTYRLIMSPRGEVSEAIVPEAVTRAAQGSPFLAGLPRGLLTSEGTKALFALLFPVFPEPEVSDGSTWVEVEKSPRSPRPLVVTRTRTVASLGPQVAALETSVVASVDPDATVPKADGEPSITVESESLTGQGAVSFDTDEGRVTTTSEKWVRKGTYKLNGDPVVSSGEQVTSLRLLNNKEASK